MIRLGITLLCGVGLYASIFMLRKSRMAECGAFDAPSIVEKPHARLFFGVPNSLIGSFYYPVVAATVWLCPWTVALRLVALPVALAAVTSSYLAYSLLFVTKQPCEYCWMAHIVNWMLLVLLIPGTLSA